MKTNDDGTTDGWSLTKVHKFWNNIATHHHVFYLYDNESKLLDILAGFVGTGITADNCTIVIATAAHIEKLHFRLASHGLHINRLIEDDRYVPVIAEEILPRFMVNGLPDEPLFHQCIKEIMAIGQRRNRAIRVFREMSALLCTNEDTAYTQLQTLWNHFSQEETLLLFSAYPSSKVAEEKYAELHKAGFTQSKLVRNSATISEILYKDC